MTREERRREAKRLYKRGKGLTIREIAERLGVSPGTIHRDINEEARERYQQAWREWDERRKTSSNRNVTTTDRREGHGHHHPAEGAAAHRGAEQGE